uniref:Exocyst complex component Sec6 n=1 Tax=Parastrongyloides trichosuri TaxID=131310 RepID=A0A0N4ZTF8_PARTI
MYNVNLKKAEESAIQKVANMFTRPEHLDRLEIQTKKAERKKAAVEAMLRTGVQYQLEGIRTAVNRLQISFDDIGTVTDGLSNIKDGLESIPQLKIKMEKLSEANNVHSQYAAAMENLKHIINVNESVDKATNFLQEGKLLHSHKIIMELENARDDLMYEVYKLRSDRAAGEIQLLKNYFNEVDILINQLGKQLWFICQRGLQAVRSEDGGCEKLVSALRIIEREERIDKFYISKQSNTYDFMPPGRPRKWKKKLFNVLRESVKECIEGTQIEDRQTNTNWFARYLEVIRRTVVEDLKIVKSGLVSCFPPEYGIYDRYILMYHDSISEILREKAADDLEKNELVQLLSWIHVYPTEEMLGNPRLDININELLMERPLLSKETTNQLYDKFIDMTNKDLTSWLSNTISQEKNDWYKNELPEEESNGFYYTLLPSTLFGMVEDTISLTKQISQELIPRVINIIIDQFDQFSQKYRDAAIAYKTKHFEDRSRFSQFTSTVMAIANNSDMFCESTEKLEKTIRMTMESNFDIEQNNEIGSQSLNNYSGIISRKELIEKVYKLKTKWTTLMSNAISDLIEEVVVDINPYLQELLTKKWINDSSFIDTICITIVDYNSDYKHLRPHICRKLLEELQYKLCGEYLISIENRKITFSSYDERFAAAERFQNDANTIERMYLDFMNKGGFEFHTFQKLFSSIADIWKLSDKSLLSLETSAFARKYPDIPEDLFGAILQARGDMTKSESKSMAEEALSHVKFHPKGDKELTKLFSMTKQQTKRGFPYIEEGVQSIFANLMQ